MSGDAIGLTAWMLSLPALFWPQMCLFRVVVRHMNAVL
jgi:hypothetical protein